MITGPLFESILEAFRNYTGSKDDDEEILYVMSEYDTYIFLAYKYIKTNKISNNETFYKVFFEFASKHSSINSYWNDYLTDNPEYNFTIEEFINEIFLKNADDEFHDYEDIQQYYTGNGGYEVGSCSLIVLRMILLELRTVEAL
jgi:hypothetical protein